MNGQAKTDDRSNPGHKTGPKSATRTHLRRIVYDAMVLREPFSGVENAVAELASALVRRQHTGFECSVLWPRSLRSAVHPTPMHHNSLEHCGPWNPSRALRLLWEQIVLPIRLQHYGADLLHAPAYLAPLGASCPVVLTVYDLHALDHPERCRPLNRWNYRLLLPRSIRKAARIIVPSDHTRDAVLRRYPAVSARVRVIPPGIHSRFRMPNPRDTMQNAAEWYPALPRRYLLCVGNIEPRKNLSLAVEALAALRQKGHPKLGLVVAGTATMGDPLYDAAIRYHGLESAVLQLGRVPEDVLPQLYAEAAALVFPSVDEGFGLPPLEAMACGCPVVCSDATALRQTAGEGALYFEPHSTAEMVAALEAVLTSPEQRASLQQRALRHAAHFQWPTLVRRVAEVYGEALAVEDVRTPQK